MCLNNDFRQSVVAYIDLLGFKDLITKNSGTKLREGLELLKKIRYFVGDYTEYHERDIGHCDLSKYKLRTTPPCDITFYRPAVSTFSDSIVISYPYGEQTNSQLSLGGVLNLLYQLINKIAVLALDLGILIRGAITTGLFYHHDNIVLGNPLISAHELESKTAIYPRVVMDKELIQEITDLKNIKTRKIPSIIEDFDGIHIYNYVNTLLLLDNRDCDTKDRITLYNKRLINYQKCIDDNLEKNSSNSYIYAKWKYLDNYFSIMLENPELQQIVACWK